LGVLDPLADAEQLRMERSATQAMFEPDPVFGFSTAC
jgi:hypothetical protein